MSTSDNGESSPSLHQEKMIVTSLTLAAGGQLTLPNELCVRYGLTPEMPLRIIETRSGILLIPLSDAPMDDALQQELAEWQALSVPSWELFPCEDSQP